MLHLGWHYRSYVYVGARTSVVQSITSDIHVVSIYRRLDTKLISKVRPHHVKSAHRCETSKPSGATQTNQRPDPSSCYLFNPNLLRYSIRRSCDRNLWNYLNTAESAESAESVETTVAKMSSDTMTWNEAAWIGECERRIVYVAVPIIALAVCGIGNERICTYHSPDDRVLCTTIHMHQSYVVKMFMPSVPATSLERIAKSIVSGICRPVCVSPFAKSVKTQ